VRRVYSLAIPAYLVLAASTLSLQADILSDCACIADPNFVGSSLLMRTRFDRTTKFGVVIHIGKGVLGGQPHRCICTNASRGLSVSAEFLVTS